MPDFSEDAIDKKIVIAAGWANTAANMLAIGDRIAIGYWPHWMYVLHIPISWRKFAQRKALDWFGKKFGPQEMLITGIESGTMLKVKR